MRCDYILFQMNHAHRSGVFPGVASLCCGLFLLLLTAASLGPASTTVPSGKFEFSFPDLEGRTVTQADERFKGKVMIVDIWGSWCGTCRPAIEKFTKFHEQYHEKGLEIVGIAFEKQGTDEEKVANLKAFVKEHKIPYTVLFGGSIVAAKAKLKSFDKFHSYPTTVIIDRAGKVRKVEMGFDDATAEQMEKLIQKLLSETPEATKP
jgi:thiol-disulfide isomerase/thioredoxin